MTDASTSLDMSTELRKVAERAKREPAGRFHSLAHLIDVELLAGAFARLRNDAAVGVDGITKEHYGQGLRAISGICTSGCGRSDIVISRSNGCTSPRRKVGRGRLVSPPSKIRWCRTRCARCWKRFTSRTFWTVRMASVPVAVRMMPCVR